jgi:hypothetical protein
MRKSFPTTLDFESESDGIDRDDLLDSTATNKHGFKRLLLAWSLVKEWKLDQYDREVAYEKIKTITAQSWEEAGAKTFIKPNANSIAGWQVTQVSCFFL